jgi:hypothetical protein
MQNVFTIDSIGTSPDFLRERTFLASNCCFSVFILKSAWYSDFTHETCFLAEKVNKCTGKHYAPVQVGYRTRAECNADLGTPSANCKRLFARPDINIIWFSICAHLFLSFSAQ